MSSLLKRLFSSSSSSKPTTKSLSRADHLSGSAMDNPHTEVQGSNKSDNEQAKKKLLRRLALAQNDPEPLLDLSDSELTKVDDQILSLIRVYHKYRVHLERNHLSSFTIPLHSKHFTEVSVLHLEENALCSLQLDSHLSLPSLKELYLSQNRLSTLPVALFELPQLRVLVLRENCLVEFPVSIVRLRSLTYCDLAYNRITTLPISLLNAVSLDSCTTLETLILEGNPLHTPATFECLASAAAAACQDGDVTSFAQIDAALRQLYQVQLLQQQQTENDDDAKKKGKGSECKSGAKNNLVDFAGESSLVSKSVASNNMMNSTAHSKGDSDEDDYNAADDCFARYEQKKLASKQNAIEWERNYMNAQLEQDRTSASPISGGVIATAPTPPPEVASRVTCKDKLLHQLHSEQDSLFAKINQFHDRKDAEKQRTLDKCIEQLQEHSSLLIEKLSHDIGRQKTSFTSDGGAADLLGSELSHDISQLLAQYDAKLSLKRALLLNELAESGQEEEAKLVEEFQRKDDQHQSRFRELERHEESLSLAFDTILAARDRRNEDLTEKIQLVEQELMALTFVERERRDERNDQLVADLVSQRTQLAQLLRSLLEVKRSREKKLMETLESELSKRFSGPDRTRTTRTSDTWLEEFQRLLSKEPFEVQLIEYGIDVRIGDILTLLYNELDDDQSHRHGSMLQAKLVYYLGHFVDIPIDQLRSCTAEDLLKLNIDDFELCQLIVDRFGRYTKQTDQPVPAKSFNVTSVPEEKTLVDLSEEISPNTSTKDNDNDQSEKEEEKKEPTGDKFWCEAECVICLDNKSNIVFLPCGHICTCQRCIRPNACPLSLCPLCRAEIDFMRSINI